MAKRKRVEARPSGAANTAATANGPTTAQSFTPASMLGLAAAMVAAALVYAAYWPSDSTEVQSGAARYLAGLLIAAGGLAICVRPAWGEAAWRRSDGVIEAASWAMAMWMVVATWAHAGDANLRLAVNELWWWVAAAAMLSAVRRVVHCAPAAATMLHLVVAVSAAVAVFAWHQLLIGFPSMIAQYKANPEAMLAEAGIYAEPGSALRIVFENRLYDGGPTGTFALANSMAALLVGGLVAMVGLAWRRWPGLSIAARVGWGLAMLSTGGMLVASRSRSAVVAVGIVAAILAISRWRKRYRPGEPGESGTVASGTSRKTPWVVVGGLGLAAAAAGLGILWRLGRGTEWIGQAPASLEIRFRYWIASVRMIAQSPWTGVGPGQFKARYETYRAAASTEQIADPHNWLLQIVTTGGIPAGVFGIVLATAIFWRFARLENQSGVFGDAERRVDASAENQTSMRSDGRFCFPPKWLRAGAAAGVIAVWLAGLVIGYLPTLDAAILATLAGGMVMFLAGRRSDRLENQKNASDSQADDDWRFYRRLAGWSLVAMTIHLLAAGGVIVPGVAMPLWILAGTATAVWVDNVRIDRLSVIESSAARLRMAVAAAMATLLVAWYLTAVLPIERTNRAMASFQRAWAQRRIVEAESDLRRATAADRWNADPALQHAAILAQLAIADSQNRQRWESAWDEAEAAALRRAGDDPVVIRQLGEHRLWAFQRYGDQSQLRRAAGLYERAVGLSPSHETYAAQLAEIYRETGDGDAVELAERAAALSAAGGYYERSLPFILVLPAERIGDSVASGPVRRPASDLLAPMLSP